nr:ribonuclease H-like domain, reverse transcriptase, RNA-dependent DNA polymerase [Tanacetum cinerariifolium]
MQIEIDSINKNKTWKLATLPDNHKAIGLKWVFKTKRDGNGNIIKHKARLVAKGYVQEHEIDYDEVFAPAARMETQAPRAWNMKLDQTLKSFKKCTLEQAIYTRIEKDSVLLVGVYVDDLIVTRSSKEDLQKFMSQMEERSNQQWRSHHVNQNSWRLLEQHNNTHVDISDDDEIEQPIDNPSTPPPYTYEPNSEDSTGHTSLIASSSRPLDHTPVRGYKNLFEIYNRAPEVQSDELLLLEEEPRNYKEVAQDKNKEDLQKFKSQMEERFEMSDLDLLAYCLGIEVTQTEDGISIKQTGYANKILKEARMVDCNETKIPMDPGTKLINTEGGELIDATEYRSLIGCLRYLLHTRPDLSYLVGLLSRFINSSSLSSIMAATTVECINKLEGRKGYNHSRQQIGNSTYEEPRVLWKKQTH